MNNLWHQFLSMCKYYLYINKNIPRSRVAHSVNAFVILIGTTMCIWRRCAHLSPGDGTQQTRPHRQRGGDPLFLTLADMIAERPCLSSQLRVHSHGEDAF